MSQSLEPKEIIIVDDSSDEPLLEMLGTAVAGSKCYASGTKIIYMRNKKHEGVARSRNLGIAAASGDVIAFIDDDGYAHKHWLRNLAVPYERNSVVGVGGPVVEVGRQIEKQRNSQRLSFISHEGDIVHNYRVSSIKEAGRLKTSAVRFLMGGNMSFRRNMLLEIKGVDSRFKGNAYREETDLCLRASRRGKIIFASNALAYHNTARIGGTRDVIKMTQFLYWYFRNTTIFFLKHFDFWNAMHKIHRHARKLAYSVLNGTLHTNRDYLLIDHKAKQVAAILNGIVSGILKAGNSMRRLSFANPETIMTLKVQLTDGVPQLIAERNILSSARLVLQLRTTK